MTAQENAKLVGRLVEEAIDSLKLTLLEKLTEENIKYDYVSEELTKSFELSRIRLLSNIKAILCTDNELETSSFKNKDRLILHQMKNLVNNKLKYHIQRLNNEVNPLHKQAIIDKIVVLTDSLQKIENTLIQGDYSTYSPNMTINDISVISHAEESKYDSKTKPPLITPITQKINPKFDSGVPSGLTPLLSESAERKFKPDFKTPFQQEEKQQREGREEAATSGPVHHADKTPNSFNRTDNKISSANSGREHATNQAGVTLFDMFDACLNSITNNESRSPKEKPLLEQKEKKESSSHLRNQKLFLLIIKSYFKSWRQQAKRSIPELTSTPLLEKSHFTNLKDEFGKSLFSSIDELGKSYCHTENKSFLNSGEKAFFSLGDKGHQNTTEKGPAPITAEKSFQNHTNDLSIIFSKEDIIQDYTSNNLLCTHLSFCEGKLKDMDASELLDIPSKKKSKSKEKHKQQQQETGEPDSGCNSLKESIRSSTDLKKSKESTKPSFKKTTEAKKTGKETPREGTATFRNQEQDDKEKEKTHKRSDSANPTRRSQSKIEPTNTGKKTLDKKPAIPKFEKKSKETSTSKPAISTASSNKENENGQNKSVPKPRVTQLVPSKY